MTKRLVAYYRVSTARQGRSGLGLDAQRATVEAYAASIGATIIRDFTEVESGRKCDRPKLIEALAHAKAIGTTLVVAKLDRLSRNVAFLARLMESKVDFVCCDNPHATKLSIHMFAAIAEHESERIGERIREAIAQGKARGRLYGTRNPRFAKVACRAQALKASQAAAPVNRKLNAERNAVIRSVIAELRKGGLTLWKTAHELNQQGYRTRKGTRWTSQSVHRHEKATSSPTTTASTATGTTA